MKQAILFFLLSASAIMAMDWKTATEVAACNNRPSYQKTGTRIVTLLREHKISAELLYFTKADKDNLEFVTEDSKHANHWGLYVNKRDAREARKLLGVAMSKDLRFEVTPEPKKQPAQEFRKDHNAEQVSAPNDR